MAAIPSLLGETALELVLGSSSSAALLCNIFGAELCDLGGITRPFEAAISFSSRNDPLKLELRMLLPLTCDSLLGRIMMSTSSEAIAAEALSSNCASSSSSAW